jgi:hypothetical protein
MPVVSRFRLGRFKSWWIGLPILALTSVVVTSTPASGDVGGGKILSPAARHVVPMGSIDVRVHVGPSLVGKHAGIMTIPGWSLRFSGQPRDPGNYRLFTIRAQTFTIKAPLPRFSGRSTIRIDRDFANGDNDAIAQVRVTYRRFAITRLSASPMTFYPLVHDGYRDTTKIQWYRNVPAQTESMTIRKHGVIRFRNGGRDGWWYFQWNGVVGGRHLRPGPYFVRINASDLGRTAHSPWLRVVIATKTVVVQKTVSKQGTGWASRTWARTRSGGSCNWDAYSGQLLTTCLYAVSRTAYRFYLPKGAVAGRAGATYRHGAVRCHPVLRAAQVGDVATVVFYSDGSNGWSQCWIVQVRVTFHYPRTYLSPRPPDAIETNLVRLPSGKATSRAARARLFMVASGRLPD